MKNPLFSRLFSFYLFLIVKGILGARYLGIPEKILRKDEYYA